MTSPSEKDPTAARPAARRKPKSRAPWIIAAAFFLAAIIYLIAAQPQASALFAPETFWRKVLRPLIRTTAFISVGLLAGQLIESLGWTAKLGRAAWPLIRWARLPGEAGAAFTAAFISGVGANTLLYTAWQEGRLSQRAVVVANLLNGSLPAYVLHMPTTMFVIISLTGPAGVYYVLLTFAAAWLRLAGVATVSRAVMPDCQGCAWQGPPGKRNLKEVWAETWPKFKTRLIRLLMIVAPIYLAVALAAESGFFVWLRDALSGWVSTQLVPVEAMSLVVVSLAAEFTSGFAAAGAMLEAGTLGLKEAVLALLIGNLAATPVRALRHQAPHYMAIYTPALGGKLLLISQSVRMTSIIAVAAVFWLLY